MAALEILARPLPKDGVSALARLFEEAPELGRELSIRLQGHPEGTRKPLEPRGQWPPQSWYLDIDEGRPEDELAYLRREI